MRQHRMPRYGRYLLFCFILSTPLKSVAATREYFVDASRISNGDGSSANPWKLRSNIDWTVIAQALQIDSVTIYFSSRATWNNDQELRVYATGNASFGLILDGHSRYNSVASGTAVWQSETIDANRATLTTAGGSGGTVYVPNNRAFVTIRGFSILRPTWGGVVLGEANPTLNVHDIVVEDNVIDSPVNNHGVWLGYGEAGCYNITVRNNTIIGPPLESIYIGHYNYLADTIRNVVIEYNTIYNAGATHEGDIDIKAGCFGAIVRYNKHYSTGAGHVLAGVVVQASDVQVYGNEFYSLHPLSVSDGGHGIQINADGADGVGKQLNNVLVYNNVMFGNDQQGISIFATKASITNLKILSNTIVGNKGSGVRAIAAYGNTITISAFKNNILANNGQYAIDTSSAVTLGDVNNNTHYGSTATLFRYRSIAQTWSEWRSLGFDAQGIVADPRLDQQYRPLRGSPVIAAGAALTEFTTDKTGATRGAIWDIGAYQSANSGTAPFAPTNVRVVPPQ
jgi:hypothetical protein